MIIIDWLNVILSPLVAASFAFDIYSGAPAGIAVWYFAFLGLAYTFFGGIKALANN